METHKRGFTLVEIVIAIAISAMVVALLSSIFIYAQKTINNNQVQSDLQQDSENIHGILVNIGTQSHGLSSALVAGPTLISYTGFTVDNYKALHNSNGYVGVTEFTISLPKKVTLDSVSTPLGFDTNTDYLEYKFKLNGSELSYSVVAQVYNTSISRYEVKPIDNRRKIVLSENVNSIEMKPLNWAAMNDPTDTTIGGEEFLQNMDGAKFIIKFYKKKGFSVVNYDASAIVNFRNINN